MATKETEIVVAATEVQPTAGQVSVVAPSDMLGGYQLQVQIDGMTKTVTVVSAPRRVACRVSCFLYHVPRVLRDFASLRFAWTGLHFRCPSHLCLCAFYDASL